MDKNNLTPEGQPLVDKELNILVVGFGNIGSRHAQSLFNDPKIRCSVTSLQPDVENFKTGLKRIGLTGTDIPNNRYLKTVTFPIDLAIVATPAGPRFEIVKALIQKGVKYFLLEKVVFQSNEQFREIIELSREHNCHIYINFVNRYVDYYQKIKEQIQSAGGPISMEVQGHAFGLGCNAIHYLDLFSYLTGNDSTTIDSASVIEIFPGSKRGDIYKEFGGIIKGSDDAGNTISISTEGPVEKGIVTTVKVGNEEIEIHETEGYALRKTPDEVSNETVVRLLTSQLTSIIVRDIIKGECPLTTLEKTSRNHRILFEIFNSALNLSPVALCPIT